MKLHELVRLRNLLDERIVLDDLKSAMNELLERIDVIGSTFTYDEQYIDPIKQIRTYYANILRSIETAPSSLVSLRADVEARINDITKDWHKRGYIINGQYGSATSDVNMERSDRQLAITSETKKLVQSRIDLYSDWHYPGLEIGPGDGVWTPLLVANDPLYVVDLHAEFLEETKARFPEEYQNRLRLYHTNWHGVTIKNLPLAQIGFAFAWNVINFMPYEETKEMLADVYKVMRPGGVVLFSYNNCDNPICAKYAEEGWMSWMPKTLLNQLLLELGFEVEYFNSESNVHWAEAKRPGVKRTVKAHQVLGEIKTI